MKNSALYITLFGLILIASCKKDALKVTPYVEKKPSNYIKFSNEALKYLQLPLKAYFIYKDSVTGNFDSVVVTQCDLEKKLMPAHPVTYNFYGLTGVSTFPEYYYQTFSLTLSIYNNGSQQDWFTSYDDNSRYESSIYSEVDSSIILLENKRPGDNSNTLVFNYNDASFKYLTNLSKSNDREYALKSYGVTEIPALTIEGNIYLNVIRILQNYSTYANPKANLSEYYWAKGIGIIKRTLRTPTFTKTWTLLRHGN
jgi:hypothetical protein